MFKVKSSLRVPQSPELWWMSRMNHPKFDRFSLELWCIRQLKIQKKTTKLYINFTLIQFAQQKKLVLRNKSHENQWKLQNSYILVIFPWFFRDFTTLENRNRGASRLKFIWTLYVAGNLMNSLDLSSIVELVNQNTKLKNMYSVTTVTMLILEAMK